MMKDRRVALPSALLGLAIVSAAVVVARHSPVGGADTGAPPARVCTIDLERVFDSSPQRATMEKDLAARDAQIREEIDGKKKEIERLKGERDLTRPGTDEHQRLERELVQKQADLRFVSEQFEQEMERRVLVLRDELLAEIEKVVQRVCELEGFDIVIQREFRIPKTKVVWNTAFHVRPAYDITDRVIAALPKE